MSDSSERAKLAQIRHIVSLTMAEHEESGHGWTHCMQVYHNAKTALVDFPELTADERTAVLLAALMHEFNDRKLFPNAVNYDNVRVAMYNLYNNAMLELVIELIGLVSCSENGNEIPAGLPLWKLIVRDADRLEAIGREGVKRCNRYTLSVGKPLFTADTARGTTPEEIAAIATPERFRRYTAGAKSASAIDHFYDKLLHICELQSGSARLNAMAIGCKRFMVDYLIEFGKTGTLPTI